MSDEVAGHLTAIIQSMSGFLAAIVLALNWFRKV